MREKLELRPAHWQSSSIDGEKTATGTPTSEAHESAEPPAPIFPVSDPSLLPSNVASVDVTLEWIMELFHEYHTHYHPHFPIINSTVSIETIHTESPLLFKTILLTACRHNANPLARDLYGQLVDSVRESIADVSINPNNTALDMNIQALLLLGSWPIPFNKQSDDGSWLYCGIATHLAMQNGFHRPGFAQEFREKSFSRDDLRVRTVSWIACFLVNFSLSLKLGVPCTITPDFTIRNPSTDLPPKLKHHLMIATACSNFIPTLSNNPFSATGLIEPSSRWSLVQLFDSELEALLNSNPAFPESEILLLTNRLHIQTFVMHEDIQSTVGPLETSTVMIRAFRTAVKLIAVIGAEHRRGRLKYYPTYINRSLVLASLWLLKLVALSHAREQSSPASPLLDTQAVETAENHVREAFTLLQGFSVVELDESMRAAKFLEIIGSVGKRRSAGWWGKSLRMRSRMGSGLYYDAIWEKKELERAGLEMEGGGGENADTNAAATTTATATATVTPCCAESGAYEQAAGGSGVIPEVEVHPPEGGSGGAAWNWADLDSVPVDQSFWGMLGDRDGFVSWDNPWDVFSLNPPSPI